MRHWVLLGLLTLYVNTFAGAQTPAGAVEKGDDDLRQLNDEFSNASSLRKWQLLHDVEGWTNKLKRFEVDAVKGHLVMEPYTSVWYFDYIGPFAFKKVTGDFILTTRVAVRGKKTDYPFSTFSVAGLMVRHSKRGAPFQEEKTWEVDREDYVFAVAGTTNEPGVPVLETKSAFRSKPIVKHFRLHTTAPIELRIARIDKTFVVLYKHGNGEWILHERLYRPDLTGDVQAGIITYSDFATIRSKHWYDPWSYNRSVIADGGADMIAEFEFVRFERPVIPPQSIAFVEAQGITWDDYRISNERLLKMVPALTAQ